MRDKDLYKELLGISSPWMVRDVLMDTGRDDHGCGGVEARVHVGLSSMRSVRLSD